MLNFFLLGLARHTGDRAGVKELTGVRGGVYLGSVIRILCFVVHRYYQIDKRAGTMFIRLSLSVFFYEVMNN